VNRWRQFLTLGLAALAVVLLAACGGSSSDDESTASGDATAVAGASKGFEEASKDQSGSGGTLIIGMSAGNIPYPDTPPNEGFEGRRWVGYQIYDGLANWNLAQGETVPVPGPGLAEKWSIGEDKLTWTLNLRKGVKFHDGTDFNAEAVIFNLDRIINKDFEFFDQNLYSTNRGTVQEVESYRALDPSTIEIKTTIPQAFMPANFAYITIASPTAIKRWGNQDYRDHAVGTGPFKVDKYIDGQVMELVPNQEYWGTKPKLDRVILKPMPDPATRLAALQAGQIHWAEVPPPDSKRQLEAEGYNVVLKQYPHAIIFPLNVLEKPFNDPKVREALQYAIDRDGMCKSLLNGLCTPASQLMYKGHPWYNEQAGDKYTYDPAKAKQLLTEAGYPNGFKATFPYTTGGSGNMWPGPMMELLQRNFKDVGVDLEIVPMEWNTLLTAYRAGFADKDQRAKYQGMWFSPATNAPTSLLSYASSRIPPAGCCNAAAYSNPEFDRLILAAQSEFDTAKQDALLSQAMGVMANDSPVLFLVHDLNFRVLSPKVRGFIQSQSWFADLTTVWVKQ
jgi:peptide/nickel transport system substrate-binding protein